MLLKTAITCALINIVLETASGLAPNQYYREPDYSGFNTSIPALSKNKIRVLLTRDISLDSNSDRLIAPIVSYFGAVGVGSPRKMFNVVFDTGSSETWIPYYNWFPLANNLHYKQGYDRKDTSTCKYHNGIYQVLYRGTRMTGEIYEDIVTIYEDMQRDDATVMVAPQVSFEQNFLAISDAVDGQFRYKPYDGVIGLAPVPQSASGIKNALLSLQRSQYRQLEHAQPGKVSDLIFGLWFNPNQNSKHGGELMLGGVDESRFVGTLSYHPLTSWFDWQVSLNYVMLGGQVVSCPNGCHATLETGVNSIVGPRSDVEKIYTALYARYDGDSDLWLIDCNLMNEFPVLTFQLTGIPHILMPDHYVRLFRHKDKIMCHLLIKPWDKPDWILGTTFLGAYYTIFDFDRRQVAFATSVN